MKTFLISGNRAVFPDILFLVLSLARSQNDPLFLTIVSGDFFFRSTPVIEGLKQGTDLLRATPPKTKP
jgi:hypothetical protein